MRHKFWLDSIKALSHKNLYDKWESDQGLCYVKLAKIKVTPQTQLETQ